MQAVNSFARMDCCPELIEYSVWRLWAAQVRDREGAFACVKQTQAAQAGLLAHIMDLWQDCSRRAHGGTGPVNLVEELELTAQQLVAELVRGGVAPPPLPHR